MSFREKAQIVVVSVAIALALAAGLYYFVGGPSLGPGIFNPNDDQPIIMAGGSFHIGTGLEVGLDSDGKKLYRNGYKVFQIDVTDKDDILTTVYGQQGVIDILYCRLNVLNNCSDRRDTIKLSFNNSGAGVIDITNDLEGKYIGKAPRLLPNLRSHMRKNWTMFSVTVTVSGSLPKEYKCGSDSECEVVVHTCLDGQTCMPI